MIYTVVCLAKCMVYSILYIVYTYIPRCIPPVYTMPYVTVYTIL